jgi:hypothetical protein
MKKARISLEKQAEFRKLSNQQETEFIRLQRLRINASYFDTIRIIGRGAFGEVCEMCMKCV